MKGNSIHDLAALTDFKKDAAALREQCVLAPSIAQQHAAATALHALKLLLAWVTALLRLLVMMVIASSVVQDGCDEG